MSVPVGPAQRPPGRLIPLPEEPVGHLVPKGDPDVRALARASSEHAEDYVRNVLDPQVDGLRAFARAQVASDNLFEQVRGDIESLREMVHRLPGTVAEQISQADSLTDLPSVVVNDPVLHHEIDYLGTKYSWMAPQLVRLRHAVSRQAIDDNVLGPAGDQLGF